MSSSSNSSQLELVLKWHEALDKKDINLLTEPLHEEFRYVTHPQSLNMPESSKKKWCSQMAGAIRFWTEVNRTIHSVTEAPGKVIIHYSGTIGTALRVDLHREAITIATVVTDPEDGSLKIKKVEEFIDSKSHSDFMEALEVAKADKCKQ